MTDEHVGEQNYFSSAKRPRKATSTVWEDFVKLPISGRQRARCKLCKQDLLADSKAGTSSM